MSRLEMCGDCGGTNENITGQIHHTPGCSKFSENWQMPRSEDAAPILSAEQIRTRLYAIPDAQGLIAALKDAWQEVEALRRELAETRKDSERLGIIRHRCRVIYYSGVAMEYPIEHNPFADKRSWDLFLMPAIDAVRSSVSSVPDKE